MGHISLWIYADSKFDQDCRKSLVSLGILGFVKNFESAEYGGGDCRNQTMYVRLGTLAGFANKIGMETYLLIS